MDKTTRHIEKMNKTLQDDNYRGFSQRIKNASGDKSALDALEVRITRHYESGCLSASHLARLDGMIMQRLALLAERQE